MAPPPPVHIPSSYTSLSFQEVAVSHHPPTSPTPTPIIVVTLNRPKKGNAFTETMMRELEQVFTVLDKDDRVKCVVVTGAGKIFCVGADLDIGFVGKDGGRAKDERTVDHRDGGGRVALSIHNLRKPSIAAINGSAVGVGITMVLPCTIRLGTASSKIGFVFSRRGIVMEATSSYFLPKLIGMSRALHICTTGSIYPASHPLLSGLFSEVLPTGEETVKRALELATEIVENTSTVSTAVMRDLMYRGEESAEAQHLLDSRVLYETFGTRDNAEGVKSFMEKRNVKFEGTVDEDGPSVWPWWKAVDVRGKPEVTTDEGNSRKGKAKL